MRRRGQGRGGQRSAHRAKAMLEPALLLLLHQRPAHGYALLKQLGQFGLRKLNPSAVYRALREMEALGWVTSTWDEKQTQGPPRRMYSLSAQGDEMLGWYTQNLQQTHDVISHILDSCSQHMEQGEGEYH